MAFHNPTVDTTPAGTGLAMLSGDTLYLRAGISLGSGGVAGSDGVTATDNTHSIIFGNLQSLSGIAFHATAFANTMTIGVTGLVWGSSGLRFDGINNAVTNAGNIVAHAGFGVSFAANGASVQNSGNIFGNTDAIFLTGGGNLIVNTGMISTPGDFCINVNAVAPNGVNTIDNSGTIEAGGGTAIFGGDTTMEVINTGHIYGKIEFGDAADTYDGSLGRIVGSILGGDGDDVVYGGDGRDVIEGGRGSDTIDGGAGRDRFVYSTVIQSAGNTHDTIEGFDERKDVFDLDAPVTGIDASVASGNLDDGAAFADDLVAAIGAGQLAAGHAVVFIPSTGDLAGHQILVVDRNGIAGYQKNKDYVFDVVDAANAVLELRDFI